MSEIAQNIYFITLFIFREAHLQCELYLFRANANIANQGQTFYNLSSQ